MPTWTLIVFLILWSLFMYAISIALSACAIWLFYFQDAKDVGVICAGIIITMLIGTGTAGIAGLNLYDLIDKRKS